MIMASNFAAVVCCAFLLSTCLVGFTAGTLVGESDSGTVHIQFLHRDHFLSPVSDPELNNLADRTLRAVRRSHTRTHRFANLYHDSTAANKTVVEASVYADNYEYVMTGSLGTPPVKFIAIVDSGSDLIWLQCNRCRKCLKQADPLFNPTKSDSFKQLSCSNKFCQDLQQPICNTVCPYTYRYGDGSFTKGLLASETSRWATSEGWAYHMKDMAFGCGLDDEGDFSGVDGLVGFGRGPLSLISQLGSRVGRVFSYCLGGFESATNESSSLSIGKDPNEDLSTFQFTPLIANEFGSSFYYVNLESISVGGHKLHIDPDTFAIDELGNGGTIIDSGTTITMLPQVAYDAGLDHIRKTVPYSIVQNTTAVDLDLCFNVTRIHEPRFPAVAFHFRGATLQLPTENTFMTFDSEETSMTCLGMATSGLGFSIFGNYQQQNFQILYDLEHSRLGFKEKKCVE